MASNLLSRGARGGTTVVAGQLVKIAIRMTGLIALSRLLQPADFGLVAMVSVFLTLGDLIRDSGMPTAGLTARSLTEQQASNLFWINSALGAGTATVLVMATPLLVAFYGEPRLTIVAPVMAVSLLLNGIQAQLQVQLARSGRFLAMTSTDIGALSAGIVAATVAAMAGLGYWALIIQAVGTALALLLSRWILTRWTPARPRRRHGSKSLVKAGSRYGLANFLTYAAGNVDSMAIGSIWGASALGFYSRAFQIYTVPRSALGPLTQVVVPMANEAVGAGRSPESLLLRIQFGLGALLIWVYVQVAVTAQWLVPWVLGEQWTPAVPILVALSFGGLFAAFGNVSYWSFLVGNQSKQLLRLHLVTKPLTILLVLAAVPHGPQAVAWGYSISLALSWPINLVWLERVARQRSSDFFMLGLRLLLAAAIALAGSRVAIQFTAGLADVTRVFLLCLVSSVIIAVVLVSIPASRRDMIRTIRLVRSIRD